MKKNGIYYKVNRKIDLEKILFYLLIITSGIYLPILTLKGINIRFFELIVLTWLFIYFPLRIKKIKIDFTLISLYLLLISLLISILVKNPHYEGLLLFFRIVVAACIFMMIQASVASEEILKKVVRMFIYSGVAIISMGIIALVLANTGNFYLDFLLETTFQGKGHRIQSLLPGSNRFANFSAIICSMIFAEAFFSHKINKKTLLLLIISFSGVLLSGSRGALFALILSCTIILIISMIKYSSFFVIRKTLLFISLGILVSIIIIWKMEINIFMRILGEGMSAEGTISGNIRLTYFNAVLEEMLTDIRTFFLGLGFYGQSNYLIINGVAFTPHNTYLTVLSAQGIVGLLIFVGMLINILIRGLKILIDNASKDKEEIVTQASFLTGFITLLLSYNTIGLYTTGYVWIFIGLTVVSFKKVDKFYSRKLL